MKVVYEAANLIDAHLVKHAIEETGVPVFLRGEALLGGMGELPLFGVVAVCVPDSAWDEARALVDTLPITQQPDGPGAACDRDRDDPGLVPQQA